MLRTPAGTTSRRISPSLSVESGVYGEGLSTIVFPASSAGAIFQIASITGKFHGVIAPTTPNGRRRTSMRAASLSCDHLDGDLQARGVLEPDRAAEQLFVRVLERLALLLRQQRRELADPGLESVAAIDQHLAALRLVAAPALEGARSGLHRGVELLAAALRARSRTPVRLDGLITPNSPLPATALPSIVIVYWLTDASPRSSGGLATVRAD